MVLIVAKILTNSGWDILKLCALVSEEMVEKLIAWLGQIRSSTDICIWQPNLDGIFLTKSAWLLIRAYGLVFLWRKWLWHKYVHKKMSFVCW